MKKTSPVPAAAPSVEASIAERVARLRAALGDPLAEDPRLAYYATALAEADAAAAGKSPRPPKPEFLARVDAFLAAHEIALAVMSKRHPRGDWADVTHRALALFDVESIARGHVRTAAHMKTLETELFTPWNEEPPSETRAFWKAVERAGLPFRPRRG